MTGSINLHSDNIHKIDKTAIVNLVDILEALMTEGHPDGTVSRKFQIKVGDRNALEFKNFQEFFDFLTFTNSSKVDTLEITYGLTPKTDQYYTPEIRHVYIYISKSWLYYTCKMEGWKLTEETSEKIKSFFKQHESKVVLKTRIALVATLVSFIALHVTALSAKIFWFNPIFSLLIAYGLFVCVIASSEVLRSWIPNLKNLISEK